MRTMLYFVFHKQVNFDKELFKLSNISNLQILQKKKIKNLIIKKCLKKP